MAGMHLPRSANRPLLPHPAVAGRRVITVLLPGMIERDVGRYLRELLEANSMRVLGDFDERVLERRRCLEHEIRTQLRDLSAFADNALKRAQALHAFGAGAVKSELERVEGWTARVRAIRSAQDHERVR